VNDWKNDAQTQAGIRKQWHLIRPGDRLSFKTPHGSEMKGRVVMKFDTHCVLNLGGRHGKPGLCDAANFVQHFPQRNKGTT
jgi:hypothetical protein